MTREAILKRCLAIVRDFRLDVVGWVELESRFSELAGELADDGPKPLDQAAVEDALRALTDWRPMPLLPFGPSAPSVEPIAPMLIVPAGYRVTVEKA